MIKCLPGVGAIRVMTGHAKKARGSLPPFLCVYRNETDSGNESLESGRKRHTTESLVFDSVHGHTGLRQGAAGTPVFAGTSMTDGGESVNRGHMMPDNRRCDSRVGRENAQGTVHHLAHLRIHAGGVTGSNEAWTWGKSQRTLPLP